MSPLRFFDFTLFNFINYINWTERSKIGCKRLLHRIYHICYDFFIESDCRFCSIRRGILDVHKYSYLR